MALFFTFNVTFNVAFLRDKASRERISFVTTLTDGCGLVARLRFDGMRAHGKDPARSFKNFNKSLLFYLNVCDFGSGDIVELLYVRD